MFKKLELNLKNGQSMLKCSAVSRQVEQKPRPIMIAAASQTPPPPPPAIESETDESVAPPPSDSTDTVNECVSEGQWIVSVHSEGEIAGLELDEGRIHLLTLIFDIVSVRSPNQFQQHYYDYSRYSKSWTQCNCIHNKTFDTSWRFLY